MRLLNLESLNCHDADLSGNIFHHLYRMASTGRAAALVICWRFLKQLWENVSNIVDFSRISKVLLEIIYGELIRYCKHNLPAVHCLPEDHAMLQSLTIEPLTQVVIPVLAYQKGNVYEI